MEKTRQIFMKVRQEGRRYLLEPEAKTICIEYGIPVTRFKVACTKEEAVKFAEEIGYPVVLKVISPDVIHKSDVGGVILNLESSGEIEDAYDKILANVKKHKPDARIMGVLVEEMASPSTEVIVGAAKDSMSRTNLIFGLGGIFVEIYKDVAFRVAPITENDARTMITEIKAYPILKGYRGRPPADTEAIVQILLSVSKLVIDHPEIKALDLNPIIVYEKGAKTVDARIIIK